MNFPPGIPILLESGYTTLTSGIIAYPNMLRLQPQERVPLLIDEVRFTTRSNSISGAGSAIDSSWQSRVRLHINDYDVTNGYIPITALCPIQQGVQQIKGTVGNVAGFVDPFYVTCKWRLPVPLLVPGGSWLSAELNRPNLTQTGPSISVNIAYAGRVLPSNFKLPRTVAVPYATAFAPTTGAAQYISRDLQLGNPFNVDLVTQRLILKQFTTQTFGSNQLGMESFVVIPDMALTLEGSFGQRAIVKKYTPLLDAASYFDRTMRFNAVLKHRDRFIADFYYSGGQTTYFPVLCLIGHRQERLS